MARKLRKTSLVPRDSSHDSIAQSPQAKIRYKYDEFYTDMFSFKEKPVSDRWIEALAAQLVKWAMDDPQALKISQFYKVRGINSSDMTRWLGRSEVLRHAHKFALQTIGDRREVGAILRVYEPGMIRYMMPHYDEDWRKEEEHKNQMSGPVLQSSQAIQQQGITTAQSFVEPIIQPT